MQPSRGEVSGESCRTRCWDGGKRAPTRTARASRPPADRAVMFPVTQWSAIIDARNGHPLDERRRALTRLITAYWRPVYCLVRWRGHDAEKAKDLTQGFFTAFLDRDFLQYVDPARGRFRLFLRTALDHYLADEWDRARAQKRGAGKAHLSLDFGEGESELGAAPSAGEDPDRMFRRKWALAIMARALEALSANYRDDGRTGEFEVLAPRLVEAGPAPVTYAQLAGRLGMSEHDVNNRLHRLRKMYRAAIWRELRALTETDAQVEDELRELFSAVAA